MKFNNIILETISASNGNLEDRELWKHINNPGIKKIVVTEISRIRRNTRDAVKLLGERNKLGV